MTHLNTQPEHGAVIEVPLSKLKASPNNARKTPHAPSDVAALAASIGAKGVIQPLVVEPERDAEGQPTGYYLVTVGEGRRQALRLRAKRKEIGRNAPVRCVVDVSNDPFEVSLDENVTRFAMHPADQFAAFQQLADTQGPEEIAARFGVTPTVVRQRLRLAAVSPRLMDVYRAGDMTLDQLMVFTITPDHAHQEQVWNSLAWNKEPHYLKRLLTQDRVRATDRRARYVGEEAYAEAGGVIERDLFAEDHGGYFADPALLDRLVLEKLGCVADTVSGEGWKWVSSGLEPPTTFQMGRVHPQLVDLSPEDQARYDDVQATYDRVAATYDAEGDPDGVLAAQLTDLADARMALDAKRRVFDPDVMARAGAFVTLAQDGSIKVERGYIRNEAALPTPDTDGDEQAERAPREPRLSDRLIADLTAHRTAALCDQLGESPSVALAALIHALAVQTFRRSGETCLEVRVGRANLSAHAPGVWESRAGVSIEARHTAWDAALPQDDDELWAAILNLDVESQLRLLAHCVGVMANAVELTHRPHRERSAADRLATALGLDMTAYWTATVDSYLGRVTKPFIQAAVREGVSEDEARRLEGMKKSTMAEAAERALDGKGWLPPVLRTEPPPEEHPQQLEAAE